MCMEVFSPGFYIMLCVLSSLSTTSLRKKELNDLRIINVFVCGSV